MKTLGAVRIKSQLCCCLFSIPFGIDGWCLILPKASRTRPERFSESPSDCFLFHYSLSSFINKAILSFPCFTALTFQGKCDFKIGHHPKMMPWWQRMFFLQAIVPKVWSEQSFFACVWFPLCTKCGPRTNSSGIPWEHVGSAELGLLLRPAKSEHAS